VNLFGGIAHCGKEQTMSKLEIIDMIVDILFIFFLILNSMYVKALEKELDALKSWIEFFWEIDFGKMAEFVAKEKRNSR
jgi:hypothetical protein